MDDITPDYNDKILAFIDIIGFSQLIRETNAITGGVAYILSILTRAKEYKLEANKDDDFKRHLEFSVFSDSIVITCPPTKSHSLFWACGYIQAELLSMGVATRGGISFGKAYHRDGILFGPTMLDSHHLESKVSVYPRIVVTDDAEARLLSLVRKQRILTDYDGLKYFDFFHYAGASGKDGATNNINPKSRINALTKIRSNIIKNLASAKDLDHKSKWNWLKNKYNDHVDSQQACDRLQKI